MDSLGENTKETQKGARRVQVSRQHLGGGGEPGEEGGPLGYGLYFTGTSECQAPFSHRKPDHHQLRGIHCRSLPGMLELCALRAVAYPEETFR